MQYLPETLTLINTILTGLMLVFVVLGVGIILRELIDLVPWR